MVLWVRSEIIGSAIIKCLGVLENWNDGILGLAEGDLLLKKMALCFTCPSFHYSTIPIFHSASIGKQNPFGLKSKPDPLGQDSLINWHQVCILYGFKSYEFKTPDKGA